MVFCRQLRLLLWKNLIVKRRCWVATLVEIFLPLALCFLLLGLRLSQPVKLAGESNFQAKPLPSAGLISLIELTCDNYVLDENRFMTFPNSSTLEFLTALDALVRVSHIIDKPISSAASSSLRSLRDVLPHLKQFVNSLPESLFSSLEDKLHAEFDDFSRDGQTPYEEIIVVLGWLNEILVHFPVSEECSEKYFTVHGRINSTDMNDAYKVAKDIEALEYIWSVGQAVVCGVPPNRKDNSYKESSPRRTKRVVRRSGYGEENDIPNDGSSVADSNKDLETFANKLLKANPKIYYAPNGTAVNEIIKKMNASIELIAYGEALAEKILNFTTEVKEEIESHTSYWENITQYNRIPGLKSRNYSKRDPCSGPFLTKDCLIWRIENMQGAACTFINAMNGSNLNFFKGFADEMSLVDYALNKASSENATVLTSLVFEIGENETLPPHIIYKIRQNITMTATTRSAKALFRYPGPRDWDDSYYKFGFLFIQDLTERAIIEMLNGEPVYEPGSYIHQAPFPCYLHDEFLLNIESIFPLILAISWVYTVALLVQNVTYEKEKRLQEVMYVMGMNRLVLWTSWFITVFVVMTFTMVMLTFLLWAGRLLPSSNPFLIFLLLEEFAAATVLMAILISTLYSRAKLATASAGIIYFVSYLPCLFIAIREESMVTLVSYYPKLFCSLSSTSAFGIAVKYLEYYELNGSGCNFGNFFKSPMDDETFTVAHVMVIIFFDCILYAALSLYIDMVFPDNHGVASKWYFPFTALYDLISSLRRNPDQQVLENSDLDDSGDSESDKRFEADPKGVEIFVALRNICKKFGRGARKYAVLNLSLNFYKDHVTALLGHNGAGKTTTMNIITGMSAPTAGSVTINGKRIRDKRDIFNASLGTCPQHNVLFSKLTVIEHLKFYAELKSGQSKKALNEEIEEILSDLQLESKRNELVDTLSGGMKRRLSVAIAFIGGSTSVVLDEPTAGVDPFARRAIWEMIMKYKKGRTIVIATHLMDEADVLADRIAVISQGRLNAVGSPLYLKQQFGDGYFLSFATDSASANSSADERANEHSSEKSVSNAFLEFFSQFGPSPVMVSSYTDEKVYLLKSWEEPQIVSLLHALESDDTPAKLGFSSFGIRDTTLEEIFMKLGTSGEQQEMPTDEEEHSSRKESLSVKAVSMEIPEFERRSYMSRYILQYFAILNKRLWCVLRNWKVLASQLLLPVIFVAGGMSISLPAIILEPYPPLRMSTFQFSNSTSRENSTVFYTNEAFNEAPTDDTRHICTSSLVEALYGVPGVGGECLVKNLNDTWLDANWPPNRKYFDQKVTYSELINDCRYRQLFNVSDLHSPLSSFLLPSYVAPKNVSDADYYPSCTCKERGTGFFCTPVMDNDIHRRMVTGDELYDLTGVDLTKYLVNTANGFPERYGGLSFGFQKANVPPHYGVNTSDKLRLLAVRHLSKVWFNNRAFHAMPVFLNLHNNALLRAALRNNPKMSTVNPGAFGMTLISHPMEGSNEIISKRKVMQSNDVLIAVFLVVGMSFVPASFVYFLVCERSSLCLHLQLMAGLSRIVYWLANFTWDLINYFVPATLCALVICAFQIPMYTKPVNFWGAVLLLFLYGWGVTPLVYLLSLLFTDPSDAYIVMIVLNLFLGISTNFTSFLLQLFGLSSPPIASLESILRHVFRVFPGFCLGRGVMDIAFNDYYNQYYEFIGETSAVTSPFSWSLLYQNIVVMSAVGLIAFLLTVFIDCQRATCSYNCKSLKGDADEMINLRSEDDQDVDAERLRILAGFADNDTVVIKRLTKIYPKRKKHGKGDDNILRAVDDLFLGVPEGECFGLLGVNGAGKTTAFKMLTGILQPTYGSVTVCGKNLRESSEELSRVGYCPQFDALYEELTAREHLQYYARIHGFRSDAVNTISDWLLAHLDLLPYADHSAGTFSGGTKRKLSAAIALVGNPKVVLLDEPTTGMDPGARRFLQSVITGLSQARKSVILTSHSMEECEILCGRLSIMVNGRMRCLGSCQHLKDKYGNGYSIRIRLNKDTDLQLRESVERFFCERVPGTIIKETHFAYLHLEVCGTALSLLFEVCDEMFSRKSLGVECYSISQNNLDNVFISFVREQNESEYSLSRPLFTSNQCPIAADPDSFRRTTFSQTSQISCGSC